jgi:methylated-DNA-[protein]-cysteine S-methyltransferase
VILQVARVRTPLGVAEVVVRGRALCALDFPAETGKVPPWRARLRRRFGTARFVARRDPGGAVSGLRRYLAGDLRALDRLAIDPGGTPLERRVWAAVRRIPPGRTVSYAALAAGLGRPRAMRAVGAANARNPVALVIPCHRVVGVDGTLRGYAAGLAAKRWLLAHEGAVP